MKKAALVLLILSLPFITGCFSVSDKFISVRKDIIRGVDGEFIRDAEFAIGPALISFAGLFINQDDDPEFLKDVSRVQVSVYKRVSAGEGSGSEVLKRIDKRMKRWGMTYIVKSCNKDEISAVYVNRNQEKGIRRIFVVSLDKSELTIVQLDGRLTGILESAIHDRGLNFSYSSE
jgi:hypothetical protein